MISILYNDLKTLIGASSLVPEEQYRITDYVTTVAKTNYTSAGYKFDIVVTALTNNTLYEYALLMSNASEAYFDAEGLLIYNIRYNVNNIIPGYDNDWVDANGKGCIYYMVDNKGNEAPYDFKNIKHNGKFLFNNTLDGTDTSQTVSEYNVVKEVIEGGVFTIPLVSFNNECHNVTIDTNASQVTITESSNLQIGDNFKNSEITNVNNTTIGNEVSDTTLTSIDGAEIGDNCVALEITNQTNLILGNNNNTITLGGGNGVIIDSNNTNVTIGTNANDVYINGSKTLDLGNNIEQFNISSSYNMTIADDCKLFNLNETNHLTATTGCENINTIKNDYVTLTEEVKNVTVSERLTNLILDGTKLTGSDGKLIIKQDEKVVIVNEQTNSEVVLVEDGTTASNPNSYINDSPSDGFTYGRKDGNWTQVDASSIELTYDDVVNALTYVPISTDKIGVANGLATLDAQGYVLNAQLPSYVDDIIEVNTFTLLPVTGEKGKIYIVTDSGKTYRWATTQYVTISESLTLGTGSEQAYPGNLGAALRIDVDNKAPLTGVSKYTIGGTSYSVASYNLRFQAANEVLIKTSIPWNTVYNVPNVKIVGTTTSGPLELMVSWYLSGSGFVNSSYTMTGTPKLDVNLFSYMNGGNKFVGICLLGYQSNLEYSVSVQQEQGTVYKDGWTIETNAANNTVYTSLTDSFTVPFKFTSHTHTKSEVGLSNVDNTSDLLKPISNATQTALNSKANTLHTHTKSEVGLSNVDNTTDANKPISNATQTALNSKANTVHIHTKSQVGLENVDNTSDAAKPVSTATQTALNGKANTSHTHTKSEVGLSNVDNTSDLTKPISTATQTALNSKADKADTLSGYGITDAYTKTEIDINLENYKTYSGFENRTDSTISINQTTGVFTLAPTTTSFNVWTNGTGKHEITTTQTKTIVADQTISYLYIDENGVLQLSTTAWNIKNGENAPCSIIFKDGTRYTITDERHSYDRNREWHNWAHSNIGTMYHHGLVGTFTNTTLSVTQGVIADEDIVFDTLNTKTKASLWYRNGASGMRMVRNSATPYSLNGATIQYDNGSGTLQPVGNNKYTCSWVYCANDSEEPIYVVIGQNQYNTQTLALSASGPIINLSTAEWKLLYKVIYQNKSGIATYVQTVDYRTVQTGVATTPVTPTSHANLTERDAANSHPATAISIVPPSGYTSTDVQGLNNEIATQITNKADKLHTHTKAEVGLANVDNTSDANKPISTATQTALNGKADKGTTLADYGITDAVTQTNILYADLLNLIANDELIPSSSYRIIDYTTTTVQADTTSAGHDFDVIVTALSANELSEDAKAVKHVDDTYFTNANLEAWEIKYCIDNDTSRFAWANTTTGKGVIYYMKDEFNNECPYDFKNIQFLNDGVYVFTFGGTTDNSLVGNSIGNIIKESIVSNKLSLNFNTFDINCNFNILGFNSNKNTFGSYCNSNTFGDSCWSNTFGSGCYNNKLGNEFISNEFGDNCYNNMFGGDCNSNIFDAYCIYNTFGDLCSKNNFGVDCGTNNFGVSCGNNTFGDECTANTFGDYSSYNVFDAECRNNKFGKNCYTNTFGPECSNNNFGNDCGNNIFIESCQFNKFSNDCNYNTFSTYYFYNTFGDDCSRNNFYHGLNGTTKKDFVRYVVLEIGCKYNNFYSNVTTGGGSDLQRIRIKGLDNSFTQTDTIITLPANTDYEWVVAKNSDGLIEQYCPEDSYITEAQITKLAGIAAGAEVNVQSDWNQTTNTADDYIKNKPTIPTVPADVLIYGTQTLTDPQKTQARDNIGAGTSSFNGNYNDLTNKPTIPTVPSDLLIYNAQTLNSTQQAQVRTNIGAGTSSFSGSYNDLSNKPTSMPASDVSAWAKAATKPSYTASEIGGLDTNYRWLTDDYINTWDSKEPAIVKLTAFNKDFGTTAGTVSEGNHTHTFESITDKPNTLTGYGITDVPSDNKTYGRKNSAWTEIVTSGGIPEAPSNNKIYGRQNTTWVEIVNSGGGGGGSIISITWAALKSLRDNYRLVPGQSYRIVDYDCTTTTTNTRSAGKLFDIIVTALDESVLSENASATYQAGDTYFSSNGAKLESWQLKYCIDNDVDRFEWVNTEGKGVIYYMKDEWENECPYDFKNIQFLIEPNVYAYTFGRLIDNTVVSSYDAAYPSYTRCTNNIIGVYGVVVSQILKYRLPFNTFGSLCNSNTLGDGCHNNKFGGKCFSNTFGTNCNYNMFGDNCNSNTFGDECTYNEFGASSYNKFGNQCSSNTFASNCTYNTFGNSCKNNTFNSYFHYNTFGNVCEANNFYHGSGSGTVKKDYIRYIVLEDGVQYNNFYSNATTSSASYLQRIRIKGGINTSSSQYGLIIPMINTNSTFEWVIAKNQLQGAIKQYCPENLVP